MNKFLTAAAPIALLQACATPAEAAGRPLSLSLSPAAQTVTEGQSAPLCLAKSGGNGRPGMAKVSASDGSWSASIAPGMCFSVPTKDDTIVNGTHDVTITATASTGATAKATITVLDNDVAPAPTPPPATQTCPDDSVILATAICPPPSVINLTGEAPIVDNFTGGIEQTWYGPTGRGGIAGPSGDPVGAFRMMGPAGQLLYDDPLVYPGQSGASHLHQFFGNASANAYSTYQSLRTTGGTNMGQPSTPYNRSSYWMPAMLDGAGNAVKADYMNLYYKRNPKSDPMCKPPEQGGVGTCVDLPNGIRFVFGYNMKTGKDGPTDLTSQNHDAIQFQCWASEDGSVSNNGINGYYHSIKEVADAGCPIGARLMIIAAAPICWNGQLDSPDHRSHMHVADGTMYTGQFFRACPATHPYLIDSLEVQVAFVTDANFTAGKWHLSSDEMVPGTVPGSTWHMDYWEAWSPTVKKTWHDACINQKLSCSGGDLGNGTQISGANLYPRSAYPTHVLVPLSSIPLK